MRAVVQRVAEASVRVDGRDVARIGRGFLVLAGNRIALAITHEPAETSVVPYLVRLLAFMIIVFAIVDKNLRRNSKRS